MCSGAKGFACVCACVAGFHLAAMATRCLINPDVDISVYSAAVDRWLRSPPLLSLTIKFGPRKTKNGRQVTVGMVKMLAGMLIDLVKGGCHNGVIQAGVIGFD